MTSKTRRTRETLWTVAATALLLFSARPAAAQMQARDSAGVRIVTYAQLPAATPQWTVASAPAFRIGAVNGTGPDVFGSVAEVAELSDGTVVVADSRAYQLRAFDRTGKHLWSVGRKGQGPGEFTFLNGVNVLRGDTLLAHAMPGARGHVFTSGGSYIRSWTFESPASAASGVRGAPPKMGVFGTLSNGTLITSPGAPSFFPSGGTPPRQSFVVALHDRAGRLLRTIGSFPEAARVEAPGLQYHPYLEMGPTTVVAARGPRFVIGTQDRFQLLVYDDAGALKMILRVSRSLIRSNPAAFARVTQSKVPVSEFLPAFREVRLDEAGSIWLQEYVPPYEERAATWWVFAPAGTLTARLTMPKGFVPYSVAPDHIVGVRSDALGVEYVERYAIAH